MKFTTATTLLAVATASPALAQLFTITGTRIPSDAVHVATLVKDGITIITGTRLPTANAVANIPISLTPVHTPTTFETRVAAAPLHARTIVPAAASGALPASPSGVSAVSGVPRALRAEENVFVEKRCLALGAECGNNGVYTDCCDDQLCTENHGTGSLTCGGVSV